MKQKRKIVDRKGFYILLILLGAFMYLGGEMANAYIQRVATVIEFTTNEKVNGKRSVKIITEIPPPAEMEDSSIIHPSPVIPQVYQREYEKAQSFRTIGGPLLFVVSMVAFSLVWFGIWRSWRLALIAYGLAGIGVFCYAVLTHHQSVNVQSFFIIPIWPIFLRFILSCMGIPFIYSNC